jgi:class 3 adenylate cyclase
VSEDLERQLAEARERQSAADQVLELIGRSTFELEPVFETVLEQAVRLCNADAGQVYVLDEDVYRLALAIGGPQAYRDYLAGVPIARGAGTLVGRVGLERRPVQIPDVLADPDYEMHEARELGGFRTMLGVPMLTGDKVIGVITLWREHVAEFGERTLDLITTFAAQGAIAIQNVQLFRELEVARDTIATFLSPQVANLVSRDAAALESHRAEITVLAFELRDFAAFAESVEPEELMLVLREYHARAGEEIHGFEGTLERFAASRLMVMFNDPVPCSDAPERAVRLAIALRNAVWELAEGWTRRGHDLHPVAGVAQGHATLGRVGFEGRSDYAAIGSVTILAERLCEAAAAGQVLVSRRVHAATEELVIAQALGELSLRGFARPAQAFDVIGLEAA